MRKINKIYSVLILFIIMVLGIEPVFAQGYNTYIVQKGDTIWKIAVRNQIGISEIVAANPQVKNPDYIQPGDKLLIPNLSEEKKMEQGVCDLVNSERAKKGLKPLKVNWEICRVARYKSQDMVNKNYFSHTSPTYGSPFDMLKMFNIKYSAAGENIAKGQTNPQDVMKSWMNSTGHRENILNANYTEIGVGYVKEGNTIIWTQMFIKP